MRLYNTLSQRVEAIAPVSQPVTIYACGITPYDTTHLGHAFTYASVDVLVRYQEYLGNQVRYVQNVTDIDDDLLKRSREVGEDWLALGDRWTSHFIGDMVSLNVRAPDVLPRATDVIPEIIAAVEELVRCGVAYPSSGSVFYSIEKFPAYGELSRLPYDEMGPIARGRGNRPDDPHKHDPLDFVLWQAHAPGEPSWDSPWGPGRPGWHIECSTMAGKYLGETIDIHAGGADLVFPHHESEIAQAEACHPEDQFVRHWMHVAMVEYQGEKMSKSLGNLIMVRDLLLDWPADALRLYLAGHHYREVWSFGLDDLTAAGRSLELLQKALAVSGGEGAPAGYRQAESEFNEAMQADLDTPEAVRNLERLAGEILTAADSGEDVRGGQDLLRRLAAVLGLRLDRPGQGGRSTGWEAHLARFQSAVSSGKK